MLSCRTTARLSALNSHCDAISRLARDVLGTTMDLTATIDDPDMTAASSSSSYYTTGRDSGFARKVTGRWIQSPVLMTTLYSVMWSCLTVQKCIHSHTRRSCTCIPSYLSWMISCLLMFVEKKWSYL